MSRADQTICKVTGALEEWRSVIDRHRLHSLTLMVRFDRDGRPTTINVRPEAETEPTTA